LENGAPKTGHTADLASKHLPIGILLLGPDRNRRRFPVWTMATGLSGGLVVCPNLSVEMYTPRIAVIPQSMYVPA